MIKFFRRIRFNLMNQNKTTKYFKYAIGEIVLVVIGILIALSISNWNEDRKDKHREVLILKNIKAELEANFEEHLLDLDHAQTALRASLKILKCIETNNLENDSLEIYFSAINLYTPFFKDDDAYKSLVSNGTQLISDETIRNDITSYYDGVIGRLEYFQLNSTRNPTKILYDYLIKNFKVVIKKDVDSLLQFNLNEFETARQINKYFDGNEYVLRIPKDMMKTLEDPEFKMLLVKAIQGATSLNAIHIRGIERINNMLAEIDQKIEILSNSIKSY